MRSLDEYALTQHYDCWQADLDRAADTGVKALRWGIPWYRVQPRPDRWDWSWTDQVLDYMVRVKGLTPILDLMHYGTPLWLDNSFINAGYPQRVAEYACSVAERYRDLVKIYTPLNEPMINADLCGRQGQWPPYLVGEDGYVKLALALARGMALSVKALEAAQPELMTVQVEALWRNWTFYPDPQVQAKVEGGRHRQFLCFDLATGRVGEDHPLLPYLRENGVTNADLAWFQENRVSFDVLGANFYPWSYGEVVPRKDGKFARKRRRTPGAALAEVVRTAWEHARIPIMITETSSLGSYENRARWMDETIEAVAGLRQEGVPVVGYTWFPLFSMFDWKYRLGRRPLAKYQINLGLFDGCFEGAEFIRRPTPLLDHFRRYVAGYEIPEIGEGA